MVSVKSYKRGCSCEKKEQLLKTGFTNGLAFVRQEALRTFCEAFANDPENEEYIFRMLHGSYDGKEDKAECPLSWQWDQEVRFDMELFHRLYDFLIDTYAEKITAIRSNVQYQNVQAGLYQTAGLVFDMNTGGKEALIIEYQNSTGISNSNRTRKETSKVCNDMGGLITAIGMLDEGAKMIDVKLAFLKTKIDKNFIVAPIFSINTIPGKGSSGDNCFPLFFEESGYLELSGDNFVYNREIMQQKVMHMMEVTKSTASVNCSVCSQRDLCTATEFDDTYFDAVMNIQSPKKFPEKWSKEQQDVIRNSEGKVAVIAPPGSGKTHTLMGIIKKRMDEGIDPQSILMFAFSNKAVEELRERVSSRYDNIPEITTINAFAFNLLLENCQKIYGFRPAVCSGRERTQLFLKLLDAYGKPITGLSYAKISLENAESNSSTISKLTNLYELYKRMGKSGIEQWNDKHSNSAVDVAAICHIFEGYEEYLKKGHMITYDQQITDAIRLLRDYPQVLGKIHEKYKYIMVDEYQDMNGESDELISLIAGDNNLLVVGDDDQSIYKFRGGSSDYLVSFCNRHPGATLHILQDNYRSTSEIIEAALRVMEQSDENRLWKDIKTFKKGAKTTIKAIQKEGEVAGIVNLVKQVSDNTPLRDIAVLARGNAVLASLKKELAKEGIAAHLNRARVIDDPLFLTLHFVTKAALYGIEKAQRELYIAALCQNAVAVGMLGITNGKTYETVMQYTDLPPVTDIAFYKSNREVERACNRLSQTEYGDLSFFVDIFRLVSVLSIMKSSETQVFLSAFASLTGLGDHLLFLFFEDKLKLNPGLSDLQFFYRELNDMILYCDEARLDTCSGESVTLATAHDSKGLEWETVIVMDVDSFVPSGKDVDPEREETITDGRRLLYTAMTRAKNELLLTFIPNEKDTSKFRFSEEILQYIPKVI